MTNQTTMTTDLDKALATMRAQREADAHIPPTKLQQAAIKRLRSIIENHISTHDRETYGKQITTFELHQCKYFIGVSMQVEMTKLGEGNLLRAIDHEYWSVHVGRGGALTVRMCPKSFEQFHGQRAFGMNFKVK